MYGHWQIGALSDGDYVKKARNFAAVMRWTDPSIELVSCGQWGWGEWDRIVLEGLAPHVRYHSIHLYTGSGDYYRNIFMSHQADRALRIGETLIERVRYEQKIQHPIGIAFDEWNVWYRTRGPEHRRAGLEERYDLCDALAVATYLNIFIRHCRSVEIANLAQMVNVIAPIFTSPKGLFLQTIYHPLRLYAEHAQEIGLDAHVECDEFHLAPEHEEQDTTGRMWSVSDLGPFKLLDVSATCNGARSDLTLAVVNRDREHSITATIQLVGKAATGGRAYEVNATHPGETNSFEHPDAVKVEERRLAGGTNGFEYTFPAHSISVLRIGVA
jgi:alpha-N-arabinofuranosidase